MLKKSVVLSLVIVFLFASSSLALETVTGNEWQEYSEEEKERYVEGFINGMNFGMILLVAEMRQGVDIDLLAEQYRRQGDLMVGEEAEELKQDIIFGLNESLEGKQTMFELMMEEEFGL